MTDQERPIAIGQDFVQNRVGTWGDRTFPQSTTRSIAIHLFREALALAFAASIADAGDYDGAHSDLADSFTSEANKAWDRIFDGTLIAPGRIAEECADVQLPLYHLAQRCGFSLSQATATKFATIQGWTWGAPDEAGVSEHTERTDATTADPTVGTADPVG